MAHILISSGPTRQYLDPVRYLSNASSGRMGRALAEAAVSFGHRVTVISGPVNVTYPRQAEVVGVVSTEDMLEACQRIFPECDGLIAAAAPSDYRPATVAVSKIVKSGSALELVLLETPDIIASLGRSKRAEQWLVGFALETDDHRARALAKLERKNCDLIVVNGPAALDSPYSSIELIARGGELVDSISGTKEVVARGIMQVVQSRLIDPRDVG